MNKGWGVGAGRLKRCKSYIKDIICDPLWERQSNSQEQ